MSQVVYTIISKGPSLCDEIVELLLSKLREHDQDVIATVRRLSPRAIDVSTTLQNQTLAEARLAVKEYGLDYDVIVQDPAQRRKKLVVFDMDSTLIQQEVIELIAAYANIEDKVAEITERAMNGELDFNQSLRERVALLKGIDSTLIWEELKHKIVLTPGARSLCAALSRSGVVMAVCSGGFIQLAEHIKNELGLIYAYANKLGIDDNNILNGTTEGPIVNGDKKASLLLEIAQKHGIEPEDAMAVGDGANDLPMMRAAGFGVAWNAKPTVQKQAPCCLNSNTLADVLYIMGYDDSEIDGL